MKWVTIWQTLGTKFKQNQNHIQAEQENLLLTGLRLAKRSLMAWVGHTKEKPILLLVLQRLRPFGNFSRDAAHIQAEQEICY